MSRFNDMSNKSEISIICVYNRKEQFHEQLYASLLNQDIEYELIAIDNTENQFKSASQALNFGCTKANGDILIFSHQDIYLKRNDEIRRFAQAIENLEIGSIVGTQGVKEVSKKYYSNITAGEIFDKCCSEEYNEELYEVSCVDEGFFGMKKKTWANLMFNEELCDNWHLYCVEMCLHTRKNHGKVYVYPSQLHHFSMGTISLGYMRNLKKLCSVYKSDFKYIWTTCYKVRTSSWYINGLVFLWCLNRRIRGNLQ